MDKTSLGKNLYAQVDGNRVKVVYITGGYMPFMSYHACYRIAGEASEAAMQSIAYALNSSRHCQAGGEHL